MFVIAFISITNVRIEAKGAIEHEVRENLARLATMTAATIDGDKHELLTDPDQEQGELYRSLNRPLTEAIKSTDGVRFVYTLRGVGERMYFVLDGTPIGDADSDGVEDHSFLMEEYEDPDPAAWEAIKREWVVVTQEPYTDLWGTFMSGFAPLRDAQGRVVGVVGVDVAIDQFQARVEHVDLAATWALVPALGLSVLLGLTTRWVTQRFVRYSSEIVEHREEAVRANQAKSSLLANISHELRTPLNAIIGFVGIAGDERCSDLERADATQTIRNNAEHLLTLINDLLDISKAEAGALSIEPTEIDLHELIERAVTPLRLRAMEKRIRFDVVGVETLPHRVVLDRTRVRQILLNLLSNAVKFTDEGRVLLTVHASDGVLTMRVRDTGPGMTRDEIGMLFKPFTQLGSSEQRAKGTGLGLAITHHITQLMNGTIGVESTPGEGTEFAVSLPIEMTPEANAPRKQTGRTEWELLSGARIAIAEDGVDNMRLLRMILKRAGAQSEGFSDGEAARVALLASPARFDLLITDWDMPVLSGEGLVRKLREAGWTRPIVSLTAHAMPELGRLCLSVGCDAHMTKPLNAKKLIETCSELIEQHGHADRAA